MPRNNFSKIEQLGISTEVIELRKEGKSYRQIATDITNKYMTDFNHMDVKRFIDKIENGKLDLAVVDDETRAMAVKEVSESLETVHKVSNELWQYIEELKTKGSDSGARVHALDKLIKVAEFLNKTTKSLERIPRTVTVNNRVNILNITENAGVFRQMLQDYMEKNNLIMVNKEDYEKFLKKK